jgi:hypothetical protein
MAETVELPDLVYTELIVGIGPIPSVRICWRAPEAAESQPEVATITSTAPAPATPSAFSQSSYFEKRTSAPAPAAVQTTAPTALATSSQVAERGATEESHETEATHTLPPDKKQDPLARFKRMPDLSK